VEVPGSLEADELEGDLVALGAPAEGLVGGEIVALERSAVGEKAGVGRRVKTLPSTVRRAALIQLARLRLCPVLDG